MDMKIHPFAFLLTLACAVMITIAILGELVIGPQKNEIAEALATCPPNNACYESTGAPVIPEFLVDTAVIKFRFITLDPDAAAEVNPDDEEGAAIWQVFEREDGSLYTTCMVWVPIPMNVLGDPDMDTLGHEVLHCLTGSFHE